MTRVDDFEEHRPLLFSIAYRILGTVSEAEDAVQEGWLRYQKSTAEPRSLKAFLSALVTRSAIDMLRTSSARREAYVGPWLPEPLLDDPYYDPERAAELADSVSMAALLLLERLSPLERAVFVLRDVFGYGYGDVAAILDRSEAACRQLLVRARRHMQKGKARFEVDRQSQDVLATRFFDAFRDGNMEGLRDLLAADAQIVGDGGAKGPRWLSPPVGRDAVAQRLAELSQPFARMGVTVECRPINGQIGAVLRDREGRVMNTMSLEILDGQVQTIRSVLNPCKLRHLGPAADVRAALSAAGAADFSPGLTDSRTNHD